MNYPSYPDGKHADSFQVGLEFQDFVCELLSEQGIILQNLVSKKRQFERGENIQGFEIKLDLRCTETKRLSIEIAEKAKAGNPVWIASGIYRDDNSWLYIQGNYEVLYVFAKKFLVLLHKADQERAQKRFPEHETLTVRAFYLSFDDADKWAAKVIRPQKEAR